MVVTTVDIYNRVMNAPRVAAYWASVNGMARDFKGPLQHTILKFVTTRVGMFVALAGPRPINQC